MVFCLCCRLFKFFKEWLLSLQKALKQRWIYCIILGVVSCDWSDIILCTQNMFTCNFLWRENNFVFLFFALKESSNFTAPDSETKSFITFSFFFFFHSCKSHWVGVSIWRFLVRAESVRGHSDFSRVFPAFINLLIDWLLFLKIVNHIVQYIIKPLRGWVDINIEILFCPLTKLQPGFRVA